MVSSAAGTFQVCAAALTSSCRAVAPAVRSGVHPWRMPWLPPVNCRWNRSGQKSACSTSTIFQSTPSSSARIMGMEVLVLEPNSGLAEYRVTTPFSPILIKLLSSNHSFGNANAASGVGLQPASQLKLSIMPPPARAETFKKDRRSNFLSMVDMAYSLAILRGCFYGCFDSQVGTASANVAVHGCFNFFFRR